MQCKQFRELLKEKEEELQLLTASFDPKDGEDDEAKDRELQLKMTENQSSKSESSKDSDALRRRVEELQDQVRSEREQHQNALMALQETMSGGYLPQIKTSAELMAEWKDSAASTEKREGLFERALKLLEEAEMGHRLIQEEKEAQARKSAEEDSNQVQELRARVDAANAERDRLASQVATLEEKSNVQQEQTQEEQQVINSVHLTT